MTTVDKRDQIVTWDGNPTSWQEYVKRVRLQYERTEYRKHGLLGAELASRLTGRAWDVASSQLDHSKLQRADGAAYLLHFLEDRLCKAPIPDTGQRLEEFFMKIRRAPGSSMAEWASQLRESHTDAFNEPWHVSEKTKKHVLEVQSLPKVLPNLTVLPPHDIEDQM